MNKLYFVEQYWSKFFNIPAKVFGLPQISLIPHAALQGYNGAWIFKRKQAIIISVPDRLVAEIAEKVKTCSPKEDFFSESFISFLFGDKVDKIIGPVFQGYYEQAFKGKISDSIRALDWEKDQKLIQEISQSGDSTEWYHGSIDEKSTAIFGYMHEGKCVAIANYKVKLDMAGFIGVYTAPDFRGKNLGKEVVKAVLKDISEKGYVAMYQTLLENAPSVGIAERLGIRKYAEHVAVRFK